MSVSLSDDGTPAAKGARFFLSGLQDMYGNVTHSAYIMSAERAYSAELHQSVVQALTGASSYVIVILLHTRGRRSYFCLPRERVFYLDGGLQLDIFRQQLRLLIRYIIKGGEKFVGKYHHIGKYHHVGGLKSHLSEREYMVLQCVLKSYDLAHIARVLGVKYKTAATHKYNLMQKLNAGTLIELHHRLCMEGVSSCDTVQVDISQEYKKMNNIK